MRHGTELSLLLLAVPGALAGCGGCDETTPPAIVREVGLTAFASCEALETYVEDLAVSEMRARLSSEHWTMDTPAREAGTVPDMQAPDDAPRAYTKTNTQVAGVDEPDFVKTDGQHLFVLSGGKLIIAASWPASELRLLSSLELEGYPLELFLEEAARRITVLSGISAGYVDPMAPSRWCFLEGCGSVGVGTKLTVIDASDPEAPRVTDELYFSGAYSHARRIAASVRLVLQDELRWPDGLQWWPAYDPELYEDESRLEAALAELQDANEVLIRAQSLADWLPPARRKHRDGSFTEFPLDCQSFHGTNAPVGSGLMTIATVNLAEQQPLPHQLTIVARAGEIYASTRHLYLTTPHWWWWPEDGQDQWTYIYKLEVSDPSSARFVAASGLEGQVLNQFSMDEYDGYLRIATTLSELRWSILDGWRTETSNRVTVLSPELRAVGATDEIAPGERIFSARFLGERGFLVTFEQIDPLFTLDLSDPFEPKVIGELEVPGFSSYIHPLDSNHLLTIGVYQPLPDANGQIDWNTRRLQLAIFDVSNFERPVQEHLLLVGTANGWSEALSEHRAFTYFPERKLLAIPFSDWRPQAGWDGFVSELRVFGVDVDSGLVPRGALSMADVYRDTGMSDWSPYYSPWVRRGIFADDFVFAISDAGARSARIDALDIPLATLPFMPPLAP